MPTPFLQNYDSIQTTAGTWIKPGGRIAAYVRSTGAQEGDDLFASSGGLVTTIAAGIARCRANRNDIVYVLDGHTETYTATGPIWAGLVAGAQVISCGRPGTASCPTLNFTHAASSMALSAADMTVSGFNIRSATASLTVPIVVTAAGVTLSNCNIISTGASGANSFVAVTSAPNFSMIGNTLVIDSTATMVAITGATSTNFLVANNIARQTQGTSGGGFSTTASTAGISGHYAFNLFKTATTGTGGAGVIVLGAATITTVGLFENYAGEETAASGLLVTGA
jgi:hypothetical protein